MSPFRHTKKQLNSRLYIDKILRASSRYANWEPGSRIEPGDYGEVDEHTGEFIKHGNIFKLSSTKAFATEELKVQTGASNTQEFVSLQTVTKHLDIEADAEISGVASVAFKKQYHFMRERGAVLVMHHARPITLEGNINAIPRQDLRGMRLITEVIECTNCFMFLSNTKGGSISLRLNLTGPAVPGVTTGGGTSIGWHHIGVAGSVKEGSGFNPDFTPLYRAKEFKKLERLRGDDDGDTATEGWVTSGPPWKILDSEGEEEQSDSDFDDEDVD
ncbi:hypothetical protein HGRIS_001986 [Hohenbuehelia grisea]|uniref:Uncharacterized protein n=1 Tax=Hohenbuehelia grisea TaxID=104357 RepID=A0ABR3JJ71_9AGAR